MTYLKEVILENFMSYEYARIPFKNGLNLIIGPNGAGKSSILLGISLALGQSHTERGRRLADLIRFGKDVARVSIVFDNSEGEGGRPFPHIRSDDVVLTRILKRDGNYYYEINYRSSSKGEVRYLLSRIGLNPDNLLIIMHQNMIEAFNFIDPKEKLKLLEDALGISGLRNRILEARERLEALSSEEKSILKAFEDIKSTVEKWESLYNKWLEKRGYLEELERLRAEYLWGKYYILERDLNRLIDESTEINDKISYIEVDIKRIGRDLKGVESDFEHYIKVLRDFIADLSSGVYVPESAFNDVFESLRLALSRYGDLRAKEAVELYQMDELRKRLREIDRLIRDLEGRIREARLEASKYPEVRSGRPLNDILADIRSINRVLERYRDIDESIEATYKYYREQYGRVEEKLREIARHRDELLKDLKSRMDRWRREIFRYVDQVSKEFSRILNYFGGTGYARVEDADDIDTARLEIYVGYGGLSPILLDAYTQSGGERTVAAVSFLLAMQRFVKSPFRAIDEFDVHMDPRNRSRVLELMIKYISETGGQYILITPGYIGEYVKDANIIVVQKVEGFSGVVIEDGGRG